MESFLPSEIGRLIYGYLSECDEDLADMFLNNSNVMEECRTSKNKSRRFNPKVQGLSLVDILDQYSILCSLIFKNVNNADCVHRNVLGLLQNMLYSKVCKRNRSLAEDLLRQEVANISARSSLTEVQQDASISEPILENVPENASNSTNVSAAVVEMHTSQNIVENMDVSSSSTVNESQTVSKVVEQSAQTEPVELISLLESDSEMVTNCRNEATEEYRERSPIDLTSPCHIPSIFDTPKPKAPIDCENAKNCVIAKKRDPMEPPKPKTKEKLKTPAPKTKAKSAPKPVSLPEPKPQQVQKSPSEHTPPEIIQNSRIRDTSVFSNLSLNPDRRKESYRTPLKPVGERILHINNDPSDPEEGYKQQVPFMEKVAKNQEKPALNTSVIDQNKSTVQPVKNSKTSMPSSNTCSIVKQSEPQPKSVQSTSKPAGRRESWRNPPTIIPPHRERPPGSKPNSRQPRESCSKSGSKPIPPGTLPKEQTPSKPPLPAEAPYRPPLPAEAPLNLPPVGDQADSKLPPEPNAKIPWDWKLRQCLPEEVKPSPAQSPRKTPKKGKRELNKNSEHPTKKRKLNEPQNTTKAKRSRSKNQPEDSELNKSSEDQSTASIDESIEEHPLAHRDDHLSSVKVPVEVHRPRMKTQSRHEAQTVPNMQIPGDYLSRSLPKIERTPEIQRMNHVPNRRSTPELNRRSPNSSRNESKPERLNSPINRSEIKHANQNSLIKSTPESRVSSTLLVEQPQTQHPGPPNITPGSGNLNEPKLSIEDDKASQASITSYAAQPMLGSTTISDILRLAAANAACKTSLVNHEILMNEDTESNCTDTPQCVLTMTEEIVLYEANVNVTPSC